MCDDGKKAMWFIKKDHGLTATLECRVCGNTKEATKAERKKE